MRANEAPRKNHEHNIQAPCMHPRPQALHTRLQSFGVWVWGLGFGVWGLGFGVWVLGFRVWGLVFRVWGLHRASDAGQDLRKHVRAQEPISIISVEVLGESGRAPKIWGLGNQEFRV